MRLALLVAALALPACRHPNLGDDFGKPNRAAMDKQIVKQGDAAGTLDGQDSQNVMNAHHSQTPAGETSPQAQQGGTAEGGPMVLTPTR
jgi:hypothetical protein